MNKTSIEWCDYKGRQLGVLKTAAARIGLSFEDYKAKLEAGQKWCGRCREWHDRSAFGVDRYRSDGLAADCIKSRSTGNPRGWSAKPKVNPATGRPGPAPSEPRAGDAKQARASVNKLVQRGRLTDPNALPCMDCGHLHLDGRQRRHEYDHYLGYDAANHLDVQAVCSMCHATREKARRAS